MLFKKGSVLEFILADDPMPILAEFNELSFQPHKEGEDAEELKLYLQHPKTTQEIQECLKDLKVGGGLLLMFLLKRFFRYSIQKILNYSCDGVWL